LKYLDFNDISGTVRLYVKKRSELALYKEVFEKISTLECEMGSQITLNVFRPYKKSAKLDAFGETMAGEEKVDVTFLTWGEWLNVNIKKEQILEFGIEAVFSVSLIKMTANGFDENDTKRRLAEMENYNEAEEAETAEVKEPEAGEGDTVMVKSFITEKLAAIKAAGQGREAPQIRPWVRLFARSIDYEYFNVIICFSLMFTSPRVFQISRSIKYIGVSAVLWILVEAVLLSTVGATPGKWLLKVTVRNDDGTRLKFKQSLLRSVFVWACGNGFQVEYLSYLANLFSYFYLKKKGKALWDEKLQVSVTHQKIGAWRSLTAILLMILPTVLIVLLGIFRTSLF
jgi:uncharacterized RDD family membrane protein YckC